tara:strand:- start:78 stop:374 length:297 start_codon:yes stop_codon:yes gene_type:complete
VKKTRSPFFQQNFFSRVPHQSPGSFFCIILNLQFAAVIWPGFFFPGGGRGDWRSTNENHFGNMKMYQVQKYPAVIPLPDRGNQFSAVIPLTDRLVKKV